MRAFSVDMLASTGDESTNLGWLLAVTPVGLPAVYLNTIGVDYAYYDNYLGDPGFVMGSARFTDGSNPATLDIEIPVSDDGPVTPDDVTRGLYRGAEVVLRMFDYELDRISPVIGFKWSIGRTAITNDGKTRFEIRSGTRINRELVLKKIGPLCPYHIGGVRCGKDLTAFTDTVVVASVPSVYEITVTGTSRADGFLDNGGFKFTTGILAGRAFTVRKYTLATGQILFWERLPILPSIGDAATVHAGCDKLRTTCNTKFDNVARHGGFNDLPPDDAKFALASEPAPSVVSSDTVEPGRYFAISNPGHHHGAGGWYLGYY